jgi:nucleotide-binding universal stress UspA family protein
MTTNMMELAQSEVTSEPATRTQPWVLTGPILVATDDRDTSDAALRVAEGIAQDHGRSLHVISVFEPLASMYPPVDGLMIAVPPTISDTARAELRLTAVRGRLRKRLRAADSCKVQVKVGQVADSIADAARDIDASLIVLGFGNKRPIDRLLGDEIVAQVVRRATCPVLAVPSDATAPLRRTVVGMDFSRASVRAARAAVSITTPPGHVWIAHVKAPLEIPTEAFEGASVIYEQGVLAAFKKIEEALEKVELLEVRPVILDGKVAEELLAFAASHRADLVVTGAHGRTLVERLLIGSVTTKLLRAAQCAVLIIPPYSGDRERRAEEAE